MRSNSEKGVVGDDYVGEFRLQGRARPELDPGSTTAIAWCPPADAPERAR
jgi:hypothetical protein